MYHASIYYIGLQRLTRHEKVILQKAQGELRLFTARGTDRMSSKVHAWIEN